MTCINNTDCPIIIVAINEADATEESFWCSLYTCNEKFIIERPDLK